MAHRDVSKVLLGAPRCRLQWCSQGCLLVQLCDPVAVSLAIFARETKVWVIFTIVRINASLTSCRTIDIPDSIPPPLQIASWTRFFTNPHTILLSQNKIWIVHACWLRPNHHTGEKRNCSTKCQPEQWTAAQHDVCLLTC